MFLFKLFGFLDFLVAILLFVTPDHIAPIRLLIGAGLYLIAKGVIYKGDLLSAIDLSIGVYCLLAIIFPITFLSFLTGIYLFLKGFYSMII